MKESVTSENVTKNEEVLKGISNFAKTIKVGSTSAINDLGTEIETNSPENDSNATTFRVCSNTLPEKTNFWTKIKNALFYEIKVELTPGQQKIEDEVNDFLYQDVTWKSFKDFLFKEVDITYKGKKVF